MQAIPRFESETIVTEETVIVVEAAGRGAWATIRDEFHPLHGLEKFASTPAQALAAVLNAIREAEGVSH